MSIILLLILVTYQTVVTVTDMIDIKKNKGKEITEKVRLGFYKEAIIWGWIPVCIIFIFLAFSTMNLNDIGLRKVALSNSKWLNIVVFVVVGVIMVSLIYQMVMYFVSEEYRKNVANDMENRKNGDKHYDNIMLRLLIPRTLKEKKCFFIVSLTAGICEEVHLRGCIMFLLADIFPDLHIILIGVIASVLFGLFHCYQGIFGIFKTAMGGMLLAMLYVVTDSLVPGIVLHFLMDFSSAFLVKAE